MSSGVGFVVGLLAVAAVVVIWLAADASRSRRPAGRPVPARPVRVQPLPPPPQVVEAQIVDDGEAARHMNKVRDAHERVTDISHRVQEAIFAEAWRRANVQTSTNAEHPASGERHG